MIRVSASNRTRGINIGALNLMWEPVIALICYLIDSQTLPIPEKLKENETKDKIIIEESLIM